MDNNQEFYTNASYFPRAFMISLYRYDIMPPKNGDLLELTDEVISSFMHELAHLVQDRGSLRGVTDFMDFRDQIILLAEHRKKYGADITVPLIPHLKSLGIEAAPEFENIHSLHDLRVHREPKNDWGEGNSWRFESYETDTKTIQLGHLKVKSPFVRLRMVNNSSEATLEHSLGAWEIKEAYSEAVARIHGGFVRKANSYYEYIIIGLILNKEFGQVDDRQIVAICHWSLQHLSPARAFSDSLKR